MPDSRTLGLSDSRYTFCYVLFFVALIPCSLAAQSINQDVARVEATYQRINDLSAEFVQETRVALLERTITRKGVLHFKKGGKLRIEYGAPERKHYISDGSTLWTYVPDDASSLMTFPISAETVPREALSFLGGFGKLRKEFAVSSSTAFPNLPAEHFTLHLKPRSKKASYAGLDALFRDDGLLTTLTITNVTGNVSTYRFSHIRTNTGLTDQLFTPE